ncbi:MAG TPA: hypothetical protein VNO35_14210 [Steroidobacteraceae bacterium]|nr:hypothetical protein [Steroidobacteraceae bacterium]
METQSLHVRAVVPLRFKLDLTGIYQRVTQRATFAGAASSGPGTRTGAAWQLPRSSLATQASSKRNIFLVVAFHLIVRARVVAKQQGWLES